MEMLLIAFVAMTNYSTAPVAVREVRAPPAQQWPQFYRVKHDVELGPIWRKGLPEVFPLDGTAVKATEAVQFLMWGLFRAGAPSMDIATARKKWRILYDDHRAFMNNTGYGADETDGLVDVVNSYNLGTGNYPKFDKVRVCGGATLTGYEVYSLWQAIKELSKTLMRSFRGAMRQSIKTTFKAVVANVTAVNMLELEYIDANQAIPPLDFVLARPWLYFTATTCASETSIGDFPQGMGEPCYIPLISRVPIRIALASVEKLPPGSPPADPYRIG